VVVVVIVVGGVVVVVVNVFVIVGVVVEIESFLFLSLLPVNTSAAITPATMIATPPITHGQGLLFCGGWPPGYWP